ncbi:flagellar assembly protein FliH [Imbroritus primus]|uniref:Flagellar assembly protein FliH n=1 Tax=Imbroritus primus TaxID=3058603 RepID=A0ACD3SWU0_9BURK|nr:flagellar assembly protein FliH [Burkholderiaceae bacterium PBA]
MHLSKPIIRREALTAYRRWEPSAFGAAVPEAQPAAAVPDPEAVLAAAEARARAREEARQAAEDAARLAGHEAGYAAGYAEGVAAGHAAGAEQVAAASAALQALAVGWRDAFQAVDTAMADSVLDLALQFSQMLVRQALAVQPERLLPVVEELLREASEAQRPATLRLHPDDVALVREHLGGDCELAGWTLFADANVTRGGCLVQTRHGAIDARLETRWQELTRALERTTPWMAA